MTPLTSV